MKRSPFGADLGDRPLRPTASFRTASDRQRIYTALVVLPLFYVLVRYFPPGVFFLMVAGAAFLALREFYDLYFQGATPRGGVVLGLVGGGLLLVSLQWSGQLPLIPSDRGAFIIILMAVFASQLLLARALHRSVTDAAGLVLGILYIPFTLGHLLLIRALESGIFFVFFVMLVTWAADTAAYYVGKGVGRRPLCPRISPKKTIEGFVGGLLVACGSAVLAKFWFLPTFSVLDCTVTAVLLSVIGLAGDLSESIVKRAAEVKDSGGIIPGHGGMLDRLDSLLFTAPAFYYYLTLVKSP